jgi:hypothetical protein
MWKLEDKENTERGFRTQNKKRKRIEELGRRGMRTTQSGKRAGRPAASRRHMTQLAAPAQVVHPSHSRSCVCQSSCASLFNTLTCLLVSPPCVLSYLVSPIISAHVILCFLPFCLYVSTFSSYICLCLLFLKLFLVFNTDVFSLSVFNF